MFLSNAKRIFILIFLLGMTPVVSSEETWIVEDIRISGLQRISAGSIFSNIPITIGDKVSLEDIQNITKSIFGTGNFDDIQIGRDGSALLINLKERPTIDEISIEGNEAIKSESLLDGLKKSGIYRGTLFKRSVFENLSSELERQYISQGRYGADVKVSSENLERNRVKLNIEIDEGSTARIKKVNIVGNENFSEEELLRFFKLKPRTWRSIFSKREPYSKENLKGDLENLESFYKNRGYLKFNVDSSIVSLSKDKKNIFITINISENTIFYTNEVSYAGDLPDAISPILILQKTQYIVPNTPFSQEALTFAEDEITSLMSNQGFSAAEVVASTEDSDKEGFVDVTVFIDPGQRTYIRKINFSGNKRTHDVVLRREMRQMEGSWASDVLLENSKRRLDRLGYFKEVEYETVPVPGESDKIDVNFSVEEEFSGSIAGSLGYGAYGFSLGANYSESNAFGTGNRITIGINSSDYQTNLQFNFFDPYFTIDGIGLGYGAYYSSSDYSAFNASAYSTDAIGFSSNLVLPINEIQQLGLSAALDQTKLKTDIYSSQQLLDYVNSEGDTQDSITLGASWTRNTLNRGLFPTAGTLNQVSTNIAIPPSDVTYGKVRYNFKYYRPIFFNLIFSTRNEIGALFAYGDTENSPPYENFYAGGLKSVRGFKQNTLGPRAVYSNGQFFSNRPSGGAYLLEGGFDFIFNLAFLDDTRSVRSSLFVDYGNVFSDECKIYELQCSEFDLSELRYSVGLGFTWITQLGPLSFSISSALNNDEYDETEAFQFEIGNQF
ncbi:outer membrane protein assembly factor BamA [Gammaproteobacteria bacterium]|nr:outer membrane protein assembly factor BamA [Gammaproteobacteria bacterium]